MLQVREVRVHGDGRGVLRGHEVVFVHEDEFVDLVGQASQRLSRILSQEVAANRAVGIWGGVSPGCERGAGGE